MQPCEICLPVRHGVQRHNPASGFCSPVLWLDHPDDDALFAGGSTRRYRNPSVPEAVHRSVP